MTASFGLRVGKLSYFERPEVGVYIGIEGVDAGYRRLRTSILHALFRAIAFPPHVTLIHPRTSSRGQGFRDQGHDQSPDLEFRLENISITTFVTVRPFVIETFALHQAA